jgi:hypothetical protein
MQVKFNSSEQNFRSSDAWDASSVPRLRFSLDFRGPARELHGASLAVFNCEPASCAIIPVASVPPAVARKDDFKRRP